MNPLLVTLTGNDTELLGKRKRFLKIFKRRKKTAKKKTAQFRARAAEDNRIKLEQQKSAATEEAQENPTPETTERAKTATVKAAAATAAANTAATESYKAERESAPQEPARAEVAPEEEPARAEAAPEEPAEEATPEEPADQGEPMGTIDTDLTKAVEALNLKNRQVTAGSWISENKVPLIILGAAIVAGVFMSIKKE